MSKVAKATIGLMIAIMLGKVLGFARELVLASTYGAGAYSDAYIIALNIPMVIFVAIGQSIGTTFIPLYHDINANLGEEKSIRFTNNIFNIVTIVCIVFGILGIVFAEPLVKLFAMGFQGETQKIAVGFTRIMVMGVLFIGLSNLMTSFLQVKNNFTIPGLASIPRNVVIIISMILSVKYGPSVLAWGTLAGFAIEFLYQVPFAYKKGYRYKKYLNLKDEHLKKMIWLLGPVFIGVAVNQVNAMVDRTLASTLVEGSISALNYANKLNNFVMGVFITSIASVIYPMLSKLSADSDKEKFTESVVTSVNSIVLLVLPISVGAIVLANPIVKILFQRGAFDSSATEMTAIALVFYSIGLVAFGLRDVLGKVFYSLQDTKTPMINGAIAMVMNIILNIILVKIMGHAGLAFATSISAILCIFMLFGSLKKKIGYFGQDQMIKTTVKSLGAALVMGLVTYLMHEILCDILNNGFIYDVINLGLSVITGAISYGVIVIRLNISEILILTSSIKKKLKMN
ncbi:murein biosynthesis integral membrane protein MurJ [Terrisporobacter petrolearius]|uniref:murein biosynthesis integral membrane protein MurJ n=1 Tax=Terrisporobacter petrolearius TaxID=1460447 RepID=UPI003AFFD7E7